MRRRACSSLLRVWREILLISRTDSHHRSSSNRIRLASLRVDPLEVEVDSYLVMTLALDQLEVVVDLDLQHEEVEEEEGSVQLKLLDLCLVDSDSTSRTSEVFAMAYTLCRTKYK